MLSNYNKFPYKRKQKRLPLKLRQRCKELKNTNNKKSRWSQSQSYNKEKKSNRFQFKLWNKTLRKRNFLNSQSKYRNRENRKKVVILKSKINKSKMLELIKKFWWLQMTPTWKQIKIRNLQKKQKLNQKQKRKMQIFQHKDFYLYNNLRQSLRKLKLIISIKSKIMSKSRLLFVKSSPKSL